MPDQKSNESQHAPLRWRKLTDQAWYCHNGDKIVAILYWESEKASELDEEWSLAFVEFPEQHVGLRLSDPQDADRAINDATRWVREREDPRQREEALAQAITAAMPEVEQVVFEGDERHVVLVRGDAGERVRLNPDATRFLLGDFPADGLGDVKLVLLAPKGKDD